MIDGMTGDWNTGVRSGQPVKLKSHKMIRTSLKLLLILRGVHQKKSVKHYDPNMKINLSNLTTMVYLFPSTGSTNWKGKKGGVTYEQTTDLYRTGQHG